MTETTGMRFRNVIPPVLTPFTKDGALDEAALSAVIDWFCHRPVGGLFMMGALGEWRFLDWPERERIIRITVEAADGRLPVIPNIGGHDDLDEIAKLGKVAREVGALAVALITPDEIPEGPEAIYEHISAVAKVVELPLALYDPRGSGPRSVTAELMRRILDDGIKFVAMKYRSLRGDDMLDMVEAIGDEVAVLAGAETVFLPTLAVGGVGVIGGGCNIYPRVIADVQRDFNAGRHDEAVKGQRRINRLLAETRSIDWPLAGKAIWQAWGLPVEPVTRAPCERCSPEAIRALQDAFGPMQDIAG